MYKKVSIVILGILLVLSVLGNMYFYKQTKKLDYSIMIGKPVESDYSTTAVDYHETLTDKDSDKATLLIFSLMDGVSIDKPEISKSLPNLAIMFSDRRQNLGYYTAKFWIDGDTVIIENSLSESKYRLLDGHRAEELKNLIESYKVKIYTD